MTIYKVLLAFLFLSLSVQAKMKVIYGVDNRQDIFEVRNPTYQRLAKSTAAMIPSRNLDEYSSSEFIIQAQSLEERGMCASERFSSQPTAADCSGFLVGKRTLVTAGHCVTNQFRCDNFKWVFDYKVERSDDRDVIVDKSAVYSCKKIVKQVLDAATESDYAVIELDRDVDDRSALKFRTSGRPKVGDQIFVIGHPTGLPSKLSDGAMIRSVGDVYFTTDLDTYGGNSGSAVFNATTGVVEGILVRGDTDYVYDPSQGCRVSNVLAQDGGDGEDVTLITQVKEILPKKVSPPAWWLRLPWWLRRFYKY